MNHKFDRPKSKKLLELLVKEGIEELTEEDFERYIISEEELEEELKWLDALDKTHSTGTMEISSK